MYKSFYTEVEVSAEVLRKIGFYKPKGSLDHTAIMFLLLAEEKHGQTKEHCERVALLAEVVAKKMHRNSLSAFYGGLLHDFGKVLLPAELFDDHEYVGRKGKAEYKMAMTHAFLGFHLLKKIHPFTAFCAGFHHNLCSNGYGACKEDIPKDWSLSKVKSMLEIATIISICDFSDAFTTRHSKVKDRSLEPGLDLKTSLHKKYPEDGDIVEIVLKVMKNMFAATPKYNLN